MRIIIPMAGRGTRLRPHTLTVPKPLVCVAGKPIVQRLVEDLMASYGGQVEDIVFITGEFGEAVENDLLALAEKLGARGHIAHQLEQLGTAHAILCAEDHLAGPVIVAFADTLFRSAFQLDTREDGVIWVQRVENPKAYGVVTLDDHGYIDGFVEKPQTFVSDQAIVGIYYFRDGENLRRELQFLLDNDVRVKGEYQLTDALQNMQRAGTRFRTGIIGEWLDCGNKDAVVQANQRVLEYERGASALVSASADIQDSTIVEPCYIGPGTVIRNAVVGPHASIGPNCTVRNAVVRNSIVQDHCRIENAVLDNAMLGSHVELCPKPQEYSLGDFTTIR